MNRLALLMNKFSTLQNSVSAACSLIGARSFSSLLGFSSINNNALVNIYSLPFKTNLNLTPPSCEHVSKCGMKVYGKLKLRCKHCYYAGIEGVVHVFCTKYPRHKQRALTARKKKYTWILSHACQGKYRPY